MTQHHDDPDAHGTERRIEAHVPGDPSLAEDLLLLLFQPRSGTIGGETTLYYVLAGAVLADLALTNRVTTTTTRIGTLAVAAAQGQEPMDEILRPAWDYVSNEPRGVQTVLAAIGPPLRQALLERLVARGDVREEKRTTLGVFSTTRLVDGGGGRRAGLLDEVRDALVNETEPTPRIAALAALISGSGSLPQFDPEIPWTSSVIARAQELERGSWGAAASAEAVTRTMAAIVASSAIVAATALRRD